MKAKLLTTTNYFTQAGPWIPVLKEGQSCYTLTPEELSTLLRRAYADGYQSAKNLYCESVTTHCDTTVQKSAITEEN